jgi:hypothetical protein
MSGVGDVDANRKTVLRVNYAIYTFFITDKAFVFRIANGLVRTFFKVQ